MITEDTLKSAIALQDQIQPSIQQVIEQCLSGKGFEVGVVQA